MADIRFKSSGLGIEEFKAQFADEVEEIIVRIRWSWEKSCSPFEKIGNDTLAHVRVTLPGTENEDGLEIVKTLYWVCKKHVIGYPYPPRLKRQRCYKVLVRKCIYPESPNFWYLDQVLGEADPSSDSSMYNAQVQKFLSEYREDSEVFTIYCTSNAAMQKSAQTSGAFWDSSSVRFLGYRNDENKLLSQTGIITVPYDTKAFAANTGIKFKKNTIYKVRCRRTNDPARRGRNVFFLEQLLESDLKDPGLSEAAAELKKDSVFSLDGVADFKVSYRESGFWIESIGESHQGGIPWNEDGSVAYVYLCSDEENPKKAETSGAILKKIYDDRINWNRKIYEAVTAHFTDEDGTIETWESDDAEGMKPEDFIKRLSIEHISVEEDDSIEVWVDPDGMFTDHAIVVYVDADGKTEVNGLFG